MTGTELQVLENEVAACRRCADLRAYCAEVARVKRRAYLDWTYWGRPVPPFGVPHAKLLIVGLAPAAHGANRTGRMFTGDRSGEWLFRALEQTGFAAQPWSLSRDDGQRLVDAYITAVVRCAPPGNRPQTRHIQNCQPYLEREVASLTGLKVVVALGQVAFNRYLAVRKKRGEISSRSGFAFGHNREFRTGPGQPVLISSYHPSQQNTSTGKLTEKMLLDVFGRARALCV